MLNKNARQQSLCLLAFQCFDDYPFLAHDCLETESRLWALAVRLSPPCESSSRFNQSLLWRCHTASLVKYPSLDPLYRLERISRFGLITYLRYTIIASLLHGIQLSWKRS